MRKSVLHAWLLTTVTLVTGGCPCAIDDGAPTIRFTRVPLFGSFDNLRGEVANVSSAENRVVVYIRIGDTWWVKPTAANPLTRFGFECRWEVDITTGGVDEEAVEIRAFVVPADFDAEVNTLPPDSVVLASVSTTREPTLRFLDVGYIGTPTQVRGEAVDIAPARYRVVVYIKVNDQWWVKPTAAAPLTPIAADGSWVVDITTASTDALATRIWAGIVREDLSVSTNDLPSEADVIASVCRARSVSAADRMIPCYVEDMFEFVEQQLADAGNDPVAGGLPAAYATDGTWGLPEDFLSYAENRAEVYDACVALVAMARLTPTRRELLIRQIADALVFVVNSDPAEDGRIRDAYYSNDIRAPEPNRDRPSTLNGETHVGNAAWAVIALCHAYAATSDARYLAAAEDVGNWIESEMRADDTLGGYFGGLLFPPGTVDYSDSNLQRVEWRSVEHNADLVAAFRSLARLTSDATWSGHANHARQFVEAPSMYDCDDGFWYLGTMAGTDINLAPLAEDTASWPWLAGVTPCADAPLSWALSTLRTVSNDFEGIRFSDAGDGVVSESTAHLALALHLAGQEEAADELLSSLRNIQIGAPNADGLSIVATPVPGNGVESGLGARYYAAPHLAATAWTILAATGVNPMQPLEAP